MDLTAYVNSLGREFAALAEAGGDDARELAERLTGPLESAIRMTLLEALSAAAGEITTDLAPGSVEVRLRGRDPDFIVTAAPDSPVSEAPETGSPEPGPLKSGPPEPEPLKSGPLESGPLADGDGPVARVNVRMPESLKASVEEAAAREGRSVNAWLVRAAAAGVQRSADAQNPGPVIAGRRSKQSFTGWVR